MCADVDGVGCGVAAAGAADPRAAAGVGVGSTPFAFPGVEYALVYRHEQLVLALGRNSRAGRDGPAIRHRCRSRPARSDILMRVDQKESEWSIS